MELNKIDPIKIRLENYLTEHFIVKFFKNINKEKVILREEFSGNYEFEIIDSDKTFFIYFHLDFHFEEEENLYSFILNSMSHDKFFEEPIFETDEMENLDELFVTINKKMKKYVLEHMYESYN